MAIQGGGTFKKVNGVKEWIKAYSDDGKEIEKAYFREVQVSPNEFLSCALAGYAFCHVFHTSELLFSAKEKCIQNFAEANCIFVDVDNAPCSMWDYINKLSIKPTLAYPSYRNGFEGLVKFRLVYFLTRPITSEEEYQEYYHGLKESIANDIGPEHGLDDHMKSVSQYINGTCRTRLNCEQSICLGYFRNPEMLPKVKVKKTGRGYKKLGKMVYNLINDTMLKDFYNKTLSTFVENYRKKYPPIKYCSDTAEYDEELHGFLLPQDGNYAELFTAHNPDGKHRKWRHNDGRIKIMFKICSIFHTIYGETLSADHLLYLASWYILNHVSTVDWHGGLWRDKIVPLIGMVIGGQYYFYSTSKYKADKIWCKANGVDVVSHANYMGKILHVREVMELWDCNKSINLNIKEIRIQGVQITKKTVIKWRKEGLLSI